MRAPAVMAVPAFRTYFTAQAVSAFGSAMSALAVTFADHRSRRLRRASSASCWRPEPCRRWC